MGKILILVTNHATLGETDEANGTYSPEITHALHELVEAGYEYDIASIKGGNAPLYGEDVEDAVNQAILDNNEFTTRIHNTIPATQLNIDDYVGVFYPGGFGLLSDLASNEDVARITASIYEKGGVVAAVCHGPAGLLPITLSDGSSILDGKTVTSFTREEEVDYGTIEKIPFLLEESLTRKAGGFTKIAPWGELIVEQDRLITGQNPASAAAVGRAMANRLKLS